MEDGDEVFSVRGEDLILARPRALPEISNRIPGIIPKCDNAVSGRREHTMSLIEEPAQTAAVISVVTAGSGSVEGEEGIFSAAREAAEKVTDIDPARLAANLAAFCAAIQTAIDLVPERTGEFRLESFEATAEITAGGQIRLVGSVQAQAKGGIKLVFAWP